MGRKKREANSTLNKTAKELVERAAEEVVDDDG